ncbi:MAG: hypoxanthine phosphoribosyltransferase [Clostridia bacterium]|nr:hypoxanthine phosphoribosyltransferase [Clostridia bacterium]
MKERVTTLISEEALKARVQEIAKEITEFYNGEEVKTVCVLKGAVMFMVDLVKSLDLPVKFDFMDVSSYGNSTESSGNIKILKDLDDPIEGENLLIVEDIIDSGRTLHYLMDYLKSKKPKSVKLCTLFDKPERREFDVHVDWTGFDIPDEFIVGYGLDYAQRYRNLPYIGVLHFDED